MGRGKEQEIPTTNPVEAKKHRDEATGHLKNSNYERALASLDKAIELAPDEKAAYVSRSRCYLLLGEPRSALDDAETALKIDPKHAKALLQKAEALYYCGEFELSLVHYHRGFRARPDLNEFRLGVQKAQMDLVSAGTQADCFMLFDITSMDAICCEAQEKLLARQDYLACQTDPTFFTCADAICMFSNCGVLDEDGENVNMEKWNEKLDNIITDFPETQRMINAIKTGCSNDKYLLYPPPLDNCNGFKLQVCVYINGIVNCPLWKDTNLCHAMKMRAESCKAFLDSST